jgi:hypothetical protein
MNEWTFLIDMAGNNSLSRNTDADLMEISEGSSDRVSVSVQLNRSSQDTQRLCMEDRKLVERQRFRNVSSGGREPARAQYPPLPLEPWERVARLSLAFTPGPGGARPRWRRAFRREDKQEAPHAGRAQRRSSAIEDAILQYQLLSAILEAKR